MENPGMEKDNTLRKSAALKTFIDDEKLNDISNEELDEGPKEEPVPEDFEPFEDPKKLKEIKDEATLKDKGTN